MIVSRYWHDGQRIHVEKLDNNAGYMVYYGVEWNKRYQRFIWNSSAGPYTDQTTAERFVRIHRPGAIEQNEMCRNCTAECAGTPELTYSGCIYKTTT